MLTQRSIRFWEIQRTVAGQIAYPFSRATRVELGTGYRHVSFDATERIQQFSLNTGQRVTDDRRGIATPSSMNLATLSTALVYDTSVFGGTAPVLGQRGRMELTGLTGDLSYLSPMLDYRFYLMPFERLPLTVAGRGMHFGNYGSDAEDPRVRPIFLGSPTLVRGYTSNFELVSDPVFDRMQGSRIAVANAELRLPLTGVRGVVGGAFLPPVDAALFYDAGVAWGRGERPGVLGGDRRSVASYGAALRVNLGGLVLEFAYVNPADFEARGWHWQFNLTPGF